jgi:hypothetical protein
MVDKALFDIAEFRSRREAEDRNEMKIIIDCESIQEEPEDEEDQPGEEEGE